MSESESRPLNNLFTANERPRQSASCEVSLSWLSESVDVFSLAFVRRSLKRMTEDFPGGDLSVTGVCFQNLGYFNIGIGVVTYI